MRMNLRSQSTRIDRVSLTSSQVLHPSSGRVSLKASLLESSLESLQTHIIRKSQELYGQQPKPLQIESVISLVQQRNTFLMVGTGYGKTRVAELYARLFLKGQKGIVLVINPLDALGENQVICRTSFNDIRCIHG